MIEFIVVLTTVVIIAIIVGRAIDRRNRWDLPVHPFECFPCRTRFRTAQQLVAHLHGNHGVDFEHTEVAVHRGYRIDKGG